MEYKSYYHKSGKHTCRGDLLNDLSVSHEQGVGLVLDCSPTGEPLLCGHSAMLNVYGKVDTIDNHLQMAKRFYLLDEDGKPALTALDEHIYKVPNVDLHRGRHPDECFIGTLKLKQGFIGQWHILLWVKYLDAHPELAKYITNFIRFVDHSSPSEMVEATTIFKRYTTSGRDGLLDDAKVLLGILNQQKRVNKQYAEEHPHGGDTIEDLL